MDKKQLQKTVLKIKLQRVQSNILNICIQFMSQFHCAMLRSNVVEVFIPSLASMLNQ